MKLLGHHYVTKAVIGKLTPLICAGVNVPDIVPYVKQNTFSFEEIHEDPEKVYPFSKELALGMMAHSKRFGADIFNNDIENWLVKDDEVLRKKIEEWVSVCTGKHENLRAWVFNFLWLGMDFYLLDQDKPLVSQIIENTKMIDVTFVSEILARSFDKNPEEVSKVVEGILKPVLANDFLDKRGLVSSFNDAVAGFGDKVDVEGGLKLTNFIYKTFAGEWESILHKVAEDVAKRMSPFLPIDDPISK